MNRHEFLRELQKVLEEELGAGQAREHVDYYRNYISEEIGNGKTEEEIMKMLGDPWVIARSIIDSPVHENYEYQSSDTVYGSGSGEEGSGAKRPLSREKLRLWLVVGGILLVLVLVLGMIWNVMKFAAPVLVPVIVVWTILKIWKNKE